MELKPAITRLRDKIKDKEQEFKDKVKAIPDPYSIRIEERIPTRVRIFNYFPVANIKGCYFKRAETEATAFAFVENLLNKITFPYFVLTKHIQMEKVLELSRYGGNVLIDEIVRIIKTTHPLILFINS